MKISVNFLDIICKKLTIIFKPGSNLVAALMKEVNPVLSKLINKMAKSFPKLYVELETNYIAFSQNARNHLSK